MTPYARPSRQLTISQSDSTVSLTGQDGQTQVLHLDGRKERIELPGIEPVEITSRWKGGKLTIERKFGSIGTVRETYTLGADGKELNVEVRITGAEITQPLDMKRVYDLTAPGTD